jgi:hypothetical protein
MSRTKHITIDEAELLEAKFEQLEKRLENVERFLFSNGQQSPENTSMTQVLHLLTTLVDRQMSESINNRQASAINNPSIMPSTMPSTMPSMQEQSLTSNHDRSQRSENEIRAQTLNIQRLRTII